MKRVLVAGMHHESNTFNPIITGEEDFNIYRGSEILDALNDGDSISGIIRTLQADGGVEVVPVIFARAVPNGEIDRELYLGLKEELIAGIKAAGSIDALCLSLHGSMRIDGIGEAEGDILEAVREIHPDLPLVTSLDMHATVTERMLQCADGFVGYKEAPHIDCFETGAHAAQLTLEALKGTKLTTAWCRVPILIAGEQSETTVEPMKSMIDALKTAEELDEVLAASYLLGFPWADCEENGVCALVVTKEDPGTALAMAQDLGILFWETRRDFKFHTETYEPAEALAAALAAPEQPVYLSDSGDNPTAGSSADCTNFLKLILETPAAAALNPSILYAGIFDPAAVEGCRGRVGEEVTLSVGAKFDTKTSSPLILTGTVKGFIPRWGAYGADIALFHTGGVDLILTAKHIGFIGPDMFEAFGIRAQDRKLIVVKLGYLTAFHKAEAARTIMALTDGSSNEKLASLPYEKVARPFFPLDTDFNPALAAETFDDLDEEE